MTALSSRGWNLFRALVETVTLPTRGGVLLLTFLLGVSGQAESPPAAPRPDSASFVAADQVPFTAVIKFYGLIAWAEAKRKVDGTLEKGHYALLVDADNGRPPCGNLAPEHYPAHFPVLRFNAEDLVGSAYSGLQVFPIKLRDLEIRAQGATGSPNLGKLGRVGYVSPNREKVENDFIKDKAVNYKDRLAARVWISNGLGDLSANVIWQGKFCKRKKQECKSPPCTDNDSVSMADEVILTVSNVKGSLDIHVADFSGKELTQLRFAPKSNAPNQTVEVRVLNETAAGVFEDNPYPGEHLDVFRWFYALSKNQGANECKKDYRICPKVSFNGPRCPEASFQ